MRIERVGRPKSPQLDMNPMVDMAFLLVTFFLLATTFKVPEPAIVVLPKAVISEDLPEDQMITITVTRDGRSFVGISTYEAREPWIRRFASLYKLEFTDEQIAAFTILPGFGVDASGLSSLLEMSTEARNRISQEGIPTDSLDNQLADWIVLARTVVPRARIAIKADKGTPYRHINKVVKTLTENNILRFNLVTEIRRLYD